MWEFFLQERQRMEAFGTSHFVVLAISILLGWFILWFAKNKLDEAGQNKLGNFIAFFIFGFLVVWSFVLIAGGQFEGKNHLPIPLCNFSVLVIPFLSYFRSYKVYEVLLFWIIGGTIQAIITPDLSNDFPHITFIKYWIVHAGLVIFILYATIIYKFRPTIKSVWRAFAWTQVFFVFSVVFNYFTGYNYNYTNAKPPVKSLVDYLGEWPWYLISVQAIILPIFFIIYFLFREKKRSVA